jgi:hypothetical protein
MPSLRDSFSYKKTAADWAPDWELLPASPAEDATAKNWTLEDAVVKAEIDWVGPVPKWRTTTVTKEVNPKHAAGKSKLPLSIVPAVTTAYLALGHAEGMLKYGLVNWRATEVTMSVYLDALERHLKKFNEGEWADSVTKVPHLANALACLSIIIDAHHKGTLVDDRPLSNPAAVDFINGEGQEIWNGLRELFKDADPKHYTINNEEQTGG